MSSFGQFLHLGHISLSQCTCYVVRGRALGIHQGVRGNPLYLCCCSVCGEGVRVETMLLACLSCCSQSPPPLPTSDWCPSRCFPGADSLVGGLMYILEPHEPFKQTFLKDSQFLSPPQPPQIFTARGYEVLFSRCLSPGLHGLS